MATLATNVSFQCFGLDGKPLAGGKVYTYSAGTTTSKATYTTMAGTVANPNPVILDQNGKAKIFLGDGSYRLQIKDSNDALIDDIDQISRYVTQSEFATFQQTVNDGVTQLTEVREQIDVFVNTSIGNQKGFANGIAPLDPNVKVDPIYLPQSTETALGVARFATATEVADKSNVSAAVTPSNAATIAQSTDLGVGQTWQNMTASRSGGSTYTNNTGKPITVIVSIRDANIFSGVLVYVGGVVIIDVDDVGAQGTTPYTFVVPNGSTYSVTVNSNTIRHWSELR